MSGASSCVTAHGQPREVAVRIGELAERTGVSVRSLRYYEEQGLLRSTRTAGGQRRYTEREVERVGLIQRLYAAGLSSRTISDILPCVDSPAEHNSVASLERLVQERAALTRHIAELRQTRDALDGIIATSREYLDFLRRGGRDQKAG